jgi:soluble lytic murein transglycosylase
MLDSPSAQGEAHIHTSEPTIKPACDAASGRAVKPSAATWLVACAAALAAFGAADAFAVEHHKPPGPHEAKAAEAEHAKHGAAPTAKHGERERAAHGIPVPMARPAEASLPPDLAAAMRAIAMAHHGKTRDASALAAQIGDPVAQKLVEWVVLRHPDSDAGFERYAAFIRANPDWPSLPAFRRRAEVRLWQEHRDGATMRRFFGDQPSSPIGRLAHARLLMNEGDRADAEPEVRGVWQSALLSPELETVVLDSFPDVLTRADFTARMDRRIGAKDFATAMRAAKHLGDREAAIVKACEAAEENAAKGGALLDAIPAEARGDLGYALCRIHWLVKHDDTAAAAKVALAASSDDLRFQDTDEWWRELRLLARKLIDGGDARTAYQVVQVAAPPANPYYRADTHFMAGWIALRFLGDPASAYNHFTRIDEGTADPIVLARARLGLRDVAEPPSPQPARGASAELLHAADILYTIGERDLVLSFVSDLADESSDTATLLALGDLTARNNDAQAMLVIGKTALAKGLPLDQYAFPDVGVPSFAPVGPKLDRCIVYSIVRTESGFDQRDKSSAMAVGLMQVTPEAGRDTAKRFGVAYNWKKMVSDPVYNTQMGSAELAALLSEYRGSYIMTFAGYNAGRGRVRQWVAQHGDPRDPKVDAVDWVEQIPISETRNYVERVMENLQVYRARLGDSTETREPNLHRAAGIE